MSAIHEIFADEAWTHSSEPLRRYWCFYGGIFGPEADLYRLDTKLRGVQAKRKTSGEIKWSSLTPASLSSYKQFADCLFDSIEFGPVKFRQMFCDRALVRVAPFAEPTVSDLDVQFKLCYQFLKHSFGLEYLDPGIDHEIRVRLDGHSSQKHKKSLALFSRDIPLVLDRPRLRINVTYHQSEKVPRIQVCDLIIGAAGSKGNKMDLVRAPKRRGMTAKQKARDELSQHIYDRLRGIDASDRGSSAFNWFESTGKNGDRSNLLSHKVRIWKFRPKMYRIDEGWQNKHLDKHGQYLGSRTNHTVHSVEVGDRFSF